MLQLQEFLYQSQVITLMDLACHINRSCCKTLAGHCCRISQKNSFMLSMGFYELTFLLARRRTWYSGITWIFLSILWHVARMRLPLQSKPFNQVISFSSIFRTMMFTSFFSPTHGNCFTFNSGIDKEENNLLKSYKSGRQFGKLKFQCWSGNQQRKNVGSN